MTPDDVTIAHDVVFATKTRPGPRLPFGAWWAVALLLILAVVYFPVFTGAVVFFRDPAHWNIPARFFLAEAWRQGESPTWNPYEGLGFPVMASPLYGVFYPPNWLFALAGYAHDPRAAVAHLATWSSLAHLAFGSLGTGLLARRLGCCATGALVAALAFGLSGYTTACWTAGLLLLAGAWVPWCGLGFLAWWRSRHGDLRAHLVGIAKAAWPMGMALTMGEVFVALMGTAFGILTVAATHERRTDTGAPSPPRRRAVWASGLVALALGAALGAVTVLPARALVGTTQRGQALPRALAESCSLHPLRLLEMLVPGALGDALEDYPAASIVGEPMVDGLPLTFSVYLGVGVLALALAALERQRKVALRLAAMAFVVLLVALGKHTPVHQLLRTLVPPLAYMRYPEKYLALFVPWMSLLGGLGATRLLATPTLARRGAWLFGVLALAGASVALGLFPAGLRPHLLRGLGAAALALAGLLGSAKLLGRRPRLGRGVLVAVVALDLAAAAWPLQVFQPASVVTEVPGAAASVLADAPSSSDRTARPRVYRADAVEGTIRTFVPVANIGLGEFRSVATLVPNTATLYGVSTVPGYDAAIPVSLRLLWTLGGHAGTRLLRLLDVPYAVLATWHPEDKATPFPGTRVLLDPLPGARLVHVDDVLPRVYLAGRADKLSDQETVAHILDEDVLTGKRALLADDRPFTVSDDGASAREADDTSPGRCALTAHHHDRLEAQCDATRSSWAVFIEQFDRGWTAELDGRSAPLVRTNWLLRGVPVPAGSHRITLRYEAPGLAAGRAISLVALALVLTFSALGVVQRRGRAADPGA